MKTISTALEEHIEQDVTTLATCWKLTRADDTVMGFTDHDRPLTVGGQDYIASTGFTPSAVANNDRLSVDNMDVEGILDSASIKEQDLMAGLYDHAEIEIFRVNYNDTTQGALALKRGRLGEVSIGRDKFIAEVRGLTQSLTQNIGELYSPACRAALGDGRCKVNLASFTVNGSVTGVTNNRVFADSTRAEEAGYFDFGKITFTSGNNNGLSMEVKEYIPGSITLALPMPYNVSVSDTYSMVAGCDKSFETCIARFSNAVNFRGEPHVPGTDRILQTSGTRSEF